MKIIKYQPMFNRILLTTDTYKVNESKKILTSKEVSGVLMEVQTVFAVGPLVENVKVGDKVIYDASSYTFYRNEVSKISGNQDQYSKKVPEYRFKTVIVDDVEYLELYDRDIKAIVEVSDDSDYEPISNTSVTKV